MMWVAISQRSDVNKNGSIDVLEHAYVRYFEKFGLKLVPVSNSATVNYFDLPIEGVILTGGNDVDPASYGGKKVEGMSLVPLRDKTEKILLDIAVARKLPVLCVCRGMQFANVYFGGTLTHVAGKHVAPGTDHPVKLREKSLGVRSSVNSYHNWGVVEKDLAPDLRAFALADGLVEGWFHSSLPIAGVQWHPERKSPDPVLNEKLVMAFVGRTLFWKR
jgi:putative glutamine amidotransferase